MGLAKAAQILSAFELARRYLLKETVKIKSAKDILPLIADIVNKQQEYFVCISLINGANEIIEKRIVTIGDVYSSEDGFGRDKVCISVISFYQITFVAYRMKCVFYRFYNCFILWAYWHYNHLNVVTWNPYCYPLCFRKHLAFRDT